MERKSYEQVRKRKEKKAKWRKFLITKNLERKKGGNKKSERKKVNKLICERKDMR